MKSPRTRRSTKASPDDARKPPGVTHATRHRRGVTAGASANARAERERALVAREEAVARRERALRWQEATVRASQPPTQTRADIERLMGQLREANERLIVAAVQAQNLSDEAHTETAQARDELDDLLNELRSANERLAAGAAQAHAMTEEARAREEEYRRLSVRLLTLQDEERRRLALDLHDSTGQRLAALTMNLDIAGRATKALDARSRRALAESRALAEACAREVRTFAYLLHPPLLEEAGLLSAVRWYAEGFGKRSGIHVVVDLDEVGRLPRPIETALFRVVQESLTNVHRHASATTASIRLTVTADVVALEIHDQGHGLRDPLAHQTGMLQSETLGVGIQGMRERIRQLGGTFDVEFTDKGTTVCVGVPLNADTP
jgi:signal transduction histidine kinase